MSKGVYCVFNVINNKFYIGSSINVEKRLREHYRLLSKNTHHCIKLQNSYNVYGVDSFITFIVELTEDTLKREQFYIDTLNPEFNISLTSSAPMTGRTHTLETKEKFKNRNYSKGDSHYRTGTKWSDELRNKILLKRTGFKQTEETKRKMS